jgi:hypothetical protein
LKWGYDKIAEPETPIDPSNETNWFADAVEV